MEAEIAMERLVKHWLSCSRNPKKNFKDLTGLLKCPGLWYAAYVKLNANKGSSTPGIDRKTFTGISKQSLDKLRKEVLSKTYQWSPIRRIYIPKTDPTKLRPLGIPTRNDRIVQEVLRMILEPIFDLSFKPTSYVFRRYRSCHDALLTVNTKFKACSWFIEGNISKCFDEVNHKILMKLIRKRVQDKRVLDLISTGLKSRVISFKPHEDYEPALGTPQGGVLSPLISNIYLHEMDNYIHQLMETDEGPKTASELKQNNEYRQLLQAGKKSLAYRLKLPSLMYNHPEYISLHYVRYADNFLIGVNGNRNLALQIRTKISEFLQKNLQLRFNMEKTKVTHVSKGIPFLGHKIGRRTYVTRQRYKGKYYWRRMSISTLNVDGKRVIKGLHAKGYCDGSGKPKPQFKHLRLPQSEINLKMNYILRGLSEWWKYAGNQRQMLYMVSYILRYSTAKLYAAKFKLGTAAAVFKKCGRDLSKPAGRKKKSIVGVDDKMIKDWEKSLTQQPATEKTIPGILYTHYWETPKRVENYIKDNRPKHEKLIEQGKFKNLKKLLLSPGHQTQNPLSLTHWGLARGIRALNAPCIICGETENVQMHHIQSIAQMRYLTSRVEKHANQIGTKKVPLCKDHHFIIGHPNNWKSKT